MNNAQNDLMSFALKFPVQVRSIPEKGIVLTLDATEPERIKLAKNHDILEVKYFHADYRVTRWKRRGVKLKGMVIAEITQECVISRLPIENKITQPVELIFMPDDSKLARDRHDFQNYEIMIDVEGPDTPEILNGESIDVGAISEEFFELAIDRYPRTDDVAGLDVSKDFVEAETHLPFAVLGKLKKT